MTFSVSRRTCRFGILATTAVALTISLAGCSSGATDSRSDLTAVAESCPNLPIDALIEDDGSGSSRSAPLTEERLATIEKVVERTIVCTGHLTVQSFSSTSGATVTVYDRDLTLSAPTVNARIRQTPAAVKAVMEEIRAAYGPAVAALPSGGSDIASTFRLFGEQAAQFSDHFHDYLLLTDGLQNTGAYQISGALTPEQAQALADSVSVPLLPTESKLTIAGLGRVSGDPVPSAVIEGMVSLYTALCEKTGAGTCLVVSEAR